mmetsp:Transcript_32/g.6  ORF Transcript_32/g.6 Transcript_32/m.6 type:complete len:83 (+) Transcript_32:27-275(+)
MNNLTGRRDHHGSGLRTSAQRFLQPKISNTGIDPSGNFLNFTGKDLRQNIDVRRDTVKRVDNFKERQDHDAVGCTKTKRNEF